MATIAENIQTLRSIKSDIKNAIIQKGGSVTDAFGTYAQAITDLPSGSGNEDLINLIERDITTLNIPDGITKIGSGTFAYCSRLTSVTIPSTVIFIGSIAFHSCSSLKSITIPDRVTNIGNSAFQSCSSLKSITIPDRVTNIDNSTFKYCSALTDVTIGNGVKTIGTYAFESCSALTNITIPNSVTSIGTYAFESCSALTAITVLATTPPKLGTKVFDNTNNCPIYVPAESVNAYKTATNWSKYASRIYAIGSVGGGGAIEGNPGGGIGPIIN